MQLAYILAFLTVQGQIPEWETQMGYIPMNGLLLAGTDHGTMDIFIPMGDHGLGGWSGDGELLPGFPVSQDPPRTQRDDRAQ